MLCPEQLRVQAYFDGEVDAVSAVEIERHLERCDECGELHGQLQRTRQALRSELEYFRVPEPLAGRIGKVLDEAAAAGVAAAGRERPVRPRQAPVARRWTRSFWTGAFSGVGLSAVAVAAALFLGVPMLGTPRLVDDLVDAHLRSLMPDHLIDVVSSDRHTVKPWFAGRTDVSPAVADFEAQGYRLVGGRADYLDQQRAAVMVYQHGPHTINVFTWAADRHSMQTEVTRHGYHLLAWKIGDLQYCAVSDTGWDELRALAALIQGIA